MLIEQYCYYYYYCIRLFSRLFIYLIKGCLVNSFVVQVLQRAVTVRLTRSSRKDVTAQGEMEDSCKPRNKVHASHNMFIYLCI
jgi:hypothetical protein